MERFAGLDAGSVSVKLVVLNGSGDLERHWYRRHGGRVDRCAAELLSEALDLYPGLRLGTTGTAAVGLAHRLGAPHVNELLALAAGVRRFHPEVRTILEMGGEDSKLLLLDGDAVADFSLNSVCAAGTGSFLDQQAERMRLSIEEFADLALQSENPPSIAGRCSVFAKSDMIHLQQIGTPVRDIVAGLCLAVARNFQGAIVRNRKLVPSVAFLGGVALNRGVARAMARVLGLDELLTPDPPTILGAAGAALKARDAGEAVALDQEALGRALEAGLFAEPGLSPLLVQGDGFADRHMGDRTGVHAPEAAGGPVEAYLGIDVGSISTNLAVVDGQGRLLARRYLYTESRPIEAVRRGLADMEAELAGRADIRGVGTTGSGRYMIADFTGADTVKNEITAQAAGALHLDPDVDTIFEIGGQDSKYIRIHQGVITDFEMNKACAAGTGSFLEEQAEKLRVSVKGEFADLALGAESPCRLGERCTVFMENSLRHAQQRGAAKDDLLAGLAYSIVENYINRVVAGREVGRNIFFQGGTAYNHAVTAAFEKFLRTEVTVPPHHDVTGAIGMALIARDKARATGRASTFKGFDLARRDYSLSSFECKGCDNRCEINRVRIQGEDEDLFYGGRCERWDARRRAAPDVEDLFAFRQEALEAAHERYLAKRRGKRPFRGVIGLPRVFFVHDLLPFLSTLLWELGFWVELSPPTTRHLVKLGESACLADTCYPVKAALGHVRKLLDDGVERLFIPSFVNLREAGDPWEHSHACPLTQSFPYQARAAFPGVDILAPVLRRGDGGPTLARELGQALRGMSVGDYELSRAVQRARKAQAAFREAVQAKGGQALAAHRERGGDAPMVVVVGRAYNAFDKGVNLDVPAKLATLGVPSMPMDFLPPQDVHHDWPEMYWRSGQRILSAARAVRRDDALSALYIGNFSCGPDSFILPFFHREMAGKPYLHIEIDEHSADAGVITRCEAFLDSLRGAAREPAEPEPLPRRPVSMARSGRTVFIPRMCDHAFALEAAFRHCGVEAQVLPETDAEAVALARKHVSGKECYPFAVTTGDLLKKVFSPDFEPDRSAFWMPSGTGPCRFGQYNQGQRMILERLGVENMPIFSPMQDRQFYEELKLEGTAFDRRAWEGVMAVDLLTRCLHEARPYEAEKGAADALYAESLAKLKRALACSNGAPAPLLADIRRDFEHLERTGEVKPVIGIVGEIFVRSNRFSNEDLVRRIEALGGEAWLAPIEEWVSYVNWGALANAWAERRLGQALGVLVKSRVQRSMAHGQEKLFKGLLRTIPEPATRAVLARARPYLDSSFRGEAVLSVGKALDMIERGAAGIVNAMPFGCMPGTVVTSMLRAISAEHGAPCISIPFDGTPHPTTSLMLEAFMDQARAGR